MKKLLSAMLATALLITTQLSLITAYAQSPLPPYISIEISDYGADGISERSGRGKTSAATGDKIAVTFILNNVDMVECYQLSGNFDTEKLSAGYYSSDEWVTGDEDMDYNTIIRRSADYSDNKFDDSFSYTRTGEEPYLCLIGFSSGGQLAVESSTRLITVGFEVLDNISNIYDAFVWDDSTMVAVCVDDEEYYIDNGLTISCNHNYVCNNVEPDCENDGYIQYICTECGNEYKTDFVDSLGHSYSYVGKSSAGKFIYICNTCDTTTLKTANQLKALWNTEYINKTPTYENSSQFLDVKADNIINAKDYAMIINT